MSMTKNKHQEEYRFLLRKYHDVNDYVGRNNPDFSQLPQTLISFCIFTERLLKIKLYKKNCFLPYHPSQFANKDNIVGIIKNKEQGLKTIEFAETINLYRKIFPRSFTDTEETVFSDIYRTRNCFMHSHKTDIQHISSEEEISTKMATVWGKISKIAESVFGKTTIKAVKPSKVYTSEELRKIQEEEVRKLIGEKDTVSTMNYLLETPTSNAVISSLGNGRCPRCDKYTFSPRKNSDNLLKSYWDSRVNINDWGIGNLVDVYKCSHCGLELTLSQYEIARRIK